MDLNRNFDVGWDVVDRNYGLISDDSDSMTWRGAAPASEPETQAVARLIDTVRPVAVFSYHALAGITGATFLAPRAAQEDETYLQRCRELTETYRRAFYPEGKEYGGMRCGTTTGSLPAYVYRKLGVPVFDLEWDGNPDFKNSHYDRTTPAMMADCRERHYQGLRAVLQHLARARPGKF